MKFNLLSSWRPFRGLRRSFSPLDFNQQGINDKDHNGAANKGEQDDDTTLLNSSCATITEQDEDSSVVVLETGLVLLRNFVSNEDQQRLAHVAIEMGQRGEDGFYTQATAPTTTTKTTTAEGSKNHCQNGHMVLNTGEQRGRIYDAATRFPSFAIDHCNRAVQVARNADLGIPEMECTHVLLNMYTSSEGLIWHRDIYENDGKSDHPVVNLCIGASCRFGLKHNDEDEEQVLVLRSGDVLLFGGPCRLIKHAVLEVILEERPIWMTDLPLRFSFTFRDSPEVLGREHEFKYFKVKENLVGQDSFEVPKDCKKFVGLPLMKSQQKAVSL